MADLLEAYRQGYSDVGLLKTDPSFNPLRSRDDFKSLLSDIDEGKLRGTDQAK
jgi:hypothetical protein